MKLRSLLLVGSLLCGSIAAAQQAANVAALTGLATVTVLSKTEPGRAALQANYDVTGGIQRGTLRLPAPLPFEEQQQQALRDATSTTRNLAQLADGLGSTLGAAYTARAHADDHGQPLNLSPELNQLIASAMSVGGPDSAAGKYLFANRTTDGRTPVVPAVAAILDGMHGETDPFGRAYGLRAGAPGANPFGDSRPFQTEKEVLLISGRDYSNRPATSEQYQHGPAQDLTQSPSYPSGHTTYGYTGALLLGLLVPERYPEMVARGAEYGSSRILVGAHYAMDVLGGRTLALYDMAHLLANDPAYMNRTSPRSEPIRDFRARVLSAQSSIVPTLEANCGATIAACAREDTGRFNDGEANRSYYASTQTYTLPVVFPATANTSEDVGRVAPEAGYLLTVAYPALSLQEADSILTATEGPGGGFLDDGSAFGIYSRLNLYEATVRARDLQRQYEVAHPRPAAVQKAQ